MQLDLLPCTETIQELPLLYKHLTNFARSPKYNCKITQEQWYDAAIKNFKKAIVHFQTLRRSKSCYQENRCKKHAIRSYVEHAKKQRTNWRRQSKHLLFSVAKEYNGREWLACADCNNKAIYTRRKTRRINKGWILPDLTNDKNNTNLFAWIMLGNLPTQSLATFNHFTNYDNRYTHTLSTKNVVFMKYSSHVDKQQEENGPEPLLWHTFVAILLSFLIHTNIIIITEL